MNKQEVKQKLHNLAFVKMNTKPDNLKLADVMQIVDQIDETEKPVIPQFVAKWLEDCKEKKQSLYSALQDCDSVNNWLDIEGNEDLFARAWLDGYEVEQEKQYTVMLCNGQSLKKVYRQGDDYLDFKMGYDNFDSFTKQQLEDAGFGWVFDCEGVEVQEVQDDTEI